MVVDGLNDKDGVLFTKPADERFHLYVISESLYQHDDRFTGIIPILPFADGLLASEYVSD